MTKRQVTLPQLALIAGTRVALGAGVGLLVADRLDRSQRQAIGWTLVAIGALSTIPLAAQVLSSDARVKSDERDGSPLRRLTALPI